MVVRTLPTSTTIITGLRAIRRGSSLTKASLAACLMIAPSSSERDCFGFEWGRDGRGGFLGGGAHQRLKCSTIGPRARTGK